MVNHGHRCRVAPPEAPPRGGHPDPRGPLPQSLRAHRGGGEAFPRDGRAALRSGPRPREGRGGEALPGPHGPLGSRPPVSEPMGGRSGGPRARRRGRQGHLGPPRPGGRRAARAAWMCESGRGPPGRPSGGAGEAGMTRYAQGVYEQADGLSPAPRLRVAVGFGPGRVVGLTALVDTGSDVCAFPEEAFRGFALEKPPSYFLVRPFDGNPHAAPAYYPAVTAGGNREGDIAPGPRPGNRPPVGGGLLERR